MTTDQLKAAIERRGFLIRLWLPEEDSVKMIVMLGDQSLPCEVSREDLKCLVLSPVGLIENILGRLTGYQHIVWCKQCHEPILKRVDQKLALIYLQHNPKPDVRIVVDKTKVIHIMTRLNAGVAISPNDAEILPGTNMEEAIEMATQYRPVRYGPYSLPWTHCSKCGNHLKDGTEEVQDLQQLPKEPMG